MITQPRQGTKAKQWSRLSVPLCSFCAIQATQRSRLTVCPELGISPSVERFSKGRKPTPLSPAAVGENLFCGYLLPECDSDLLLLPYLLVCFLFPSQYATVVLLSSWSATFRAHAMPPGMPQISHPCSTASAGKRDLKEAGPECPDLHLSSASEQSTGNNS